MINGNLRNDYIVYTRARERDDLGWSMPQGAKKAAPRGEVQPKRGDSDGQRQERCHAM